MYNCKSRDWENYIIFKRDVTCVEWWTYLLFLLLLNLKLLNRVNWCWLWPLAQACVMWIFTTPLTPVYTDPNIYFFWNLYETLTTAGIAFFVTHGRNLSCYNGSFLTFLMLVLLFVLLFADCCCFLHRKTWRPPRVLETVRPNRWPSWRGRGRGTPQTDRSLYPHPASLTPNL